MRCRLPSDCSPLLHIVPGTQRVLDTPPFPLPTPHAPCLLPSASPGCMQVPHPLSDAVRTLLPQLLLWFWLRRCVWMECACLSLEAARGHHSR